MLKNPRSTALPSRLGLLLLAVIIMLPCQGGTPTLETVYSFTGISDGGFPEGGLVMSPSGALLGTTSTGGASGLGTVFQLAPVKGGGWKETTIYSFTGGGDGANPVSDLTIANNNIYYGTTYYGGANGAGTVFQIAPVTGGGWTEKIVYSFGSSAGDGANPAAGLVFNSTGVLYGTTYGGGAGFGTVFSLNPSESGWVEKLLWTFQSGSDGANPQTDLALSSAGVLYGTTSQGGSVTNSSGTFTNGGTVFSLTPGTDGAWTENVLYTFTGGKDGGFPASAVIIGSGGELYGSTFWGGTTACPVGDYPQGCGVIYQLSGSGSAWTETVLHSFTGHSPDGAHPYGNMVFNMGGVLFGTTYSGGANLDVCYEDSFNGCGTIFSLRPPSKSGSWTKSNLTVFPGSPGGGTPNGVILSKGGFLYGTTIVGGTQGGYGTVFEMTP